MNAVIYCRVSSKEQVDGTSLESQELACKEFAGRNKLVVSRIFVERGESAKFADRPQLLEMMAYCGRRENAIEQLLVWKVDRLARNVGDHFSIKAGLMKQGVSVVSVTEPIDAKPEGKLLETILAGFAQFDNDIRAARCVQGMRRKIQEGLFPWKPPLGYKCGNRPGSKKTLPDIPDQPTFGIIQQGLSEFANGSLTKAQLLRLFGERGLRTRAGKPLTSQTLDNLLGDEFYAGVVRDSWTGEEYEGKHLPMVSRATFNTIQRVIAGRSRAVPHLTRRTEFPLRQFVRCLNCEATLTGSFSRGRSARYAYYRCFRRECDNQRNYPISEVHDEFALLLSQLSIDHHRFDHLKKRILGIGTSWEKEFQVGRERREASEKRQKDQLQQLIRMKMDGLITDEEFRTQRMNLTRAIADVEGHSVAGDATVESVINDLDTICVPVADLTSFWSALPIEFQQRFQLLALPGGYVVGRVRTAQRGRLFSLFDAPLPCRTTAVHPTGNSWNQLANEIRVLSMIVRESAIH